MSVEDFKKNVLPLKDNVFRLALRFLKNQEDSEDACQEIFLKLWQKRSALSKYASVKAFALTVTRNYCIDRIRSKKYNTLELNEEILVHVNENPERDLIQSESYQLIEKLINSLPDNLKMIIHLRDIEDCSTDEVAEVLGISKINVRVNLSRARKKIRELLTKNKFKRYE